MSALELTKASYTLPEVADLTGFSLRSLQDGCRAKRIPHTRFNKQRVMTPAHIRAFLAANEVEPQSAPVSADVDRIEQHRRRVVDRLARQRGAA